MPSGYIYKCRVGAFQVDGSSNFYHMLQQGSWNQYVVLSASNTATPWPLDNGTKGTYSTTSPVLTAVTVAGNNACAPTTATQVKIIANNGWKSGTTAGVLVAPSRQYEGVNNGPAGSAGQNFPIWLAIGFNAAMEAIIQLEATTIAWASGNTGGAINCAGYKDSVNAN